MKICLQLALLCTVKIRNWIFYFSCFVVFSIIWNTTMLLPFTTINHSIEARCIHDKLDFAIKGPSPQSYNGWIAVKDESQPSNKEVYPPVTNDPNPVLYVPENYYDYDDLTKDSHSSSLVQGVFEGTHGFSSDAILQIDKFSESSSKQVGPAAEELDTKEHEQMPEHSRLTEIEYRNRRGVEAKSNPEEFDEVDRQQDNLLDLFDNNVVVQETYNKAFSAWRSNVTYKPIRLTLWYDFSKITFRNDSVEFERLKEGLDRAVEKVEQLFSVIPVHGNLFLQRLGACGGIWPDSNVSNSRKCGRIHHDYAGEKCLDDFMIPDDHLSGFETYERDSTEPSVVHFRNGTGLPDTDTVIYIRSMASQQCADGDIIAYATSCQLDQFNRPIAGYANFCPDHLSFQSYDPGKFYLAVLHEFFHVLGFSQKLFKKFQTCTPRSDLPGHAVGNRSVSFIEGSLVCEVRRDVVDFVDHWYRILTPSVTREAKEHFNCSSIGGPLEGDVDQRPHETSHWESRFIQPSLMTATIGLPHLTVLDRITLAVFNDTGWYKVNTSLASELLWGRNAGCEFGSKKYCHAGNNFFFCTGSRLASGCHYLHLDKGVCETNEFLDSCRVYKVEKGDECWDPRNANKDADLWKGETFNINSRCFISSLTSLPGDHEGSLLRRRRSTEENNTEARCYEHRCNDSKTLEIRVRGSEWIHCVTTHTKVPGYRGHVVCPNPASMCDSKASNRAASLSGAFVCVKVRLIFPGLYRYAVGGKASNETMKARYDDFTDKLVTAVNNLVSGNGTSVQGKPVGHRDTVSFDMKSERLTTRSCTEAIRRLKVMIYNRVLSVQVDGKEFMATRFSYTYSLQPCRPEETMNSTWMSQDLSEDARNDPKDQEPRSPPGGRSQSGIIAASVIGALCCTAFVTVGAILYFKSIVPNAIGPASGQHPEASYQHNSQSSPTSENGSMGQITFSV